MSKELEDKLKILVETSCLHFAEDIAKPIENALKEYELMKEIRITARFDLAQVNKEHKALEIIKKLPIEEKQMLLNAIYTYTKNEEEYSLLKEVLWIG